MIRKNKGRFILSLLILICYSTVFAFAVLASRFDPTPAIATGIILMPIIAYLLGMVWRYDLVPRDVDESTVAQASKRKRQAIDDVLRDLSDKDLIRLKHRLQDGIIDDEVLYDRLIGEDGELLRHES